MGFQKVIEWGDNGEYLNDFKNKSKPNLKPEKNGFCFLYAKVKSLYINF